MLILLVFVGLCNDVLTYPNKHASYPVPVRQFRLLPVGLLQCMGHPKPPCHLLMLPGVTPAHKGLTPSGLSFIQRTLLNLPFKAHTKNIGHLTESANLKVITNNKTYSGLKMMSVEMPNAPYSNRSVPFR